MSNQGPNHLCWHTHCSVLARKQERPMKLTRRTVLAASMATLGSSLAAPAVKASPGWPTKQPIKLIATFPPGGTADTISRILAPKLSAGLGTQVVVENKPGAGGTIGSDLAAKAAPDGYTLVISHASPLGIAPGIYPKAAVQRGHRLHPRHPDRPYAQRPDRAGRFALQDARRLHRRRQGQARPDRLRQLGHRLQHPSDGRAACRARPASS